MSEPSEDRALPEDWREVSNPPSIVEKYDPRLPTLFEYADREIGVHIVPTEPNTPHADQDACRVGFVRGSRDDLESAEPIVHCHGRDTAYHLAHEYMTAYNEADELDDRARIEAAKDAATAAVEES